MSKIPNSLLTKARNTFWDTAQNFFAQRGKVQTYTHSLNQAIQNVADLTVQVLEEVTFLKEHELDWKEGLGPNEIVEINNLLESSYNCDCVVAAESDEDFYVRQFISNFTGFPKDKWVYSFGYTKLILTSTDEIMIRIPLGEGDTEILVKRYKIENLSEQTQVELNNFGKDVLKWAKKENLKELIK